MLFEILEKADALSYPLYLARNRRPWIPGYYTAKRRQIEKAIDGGLLRPGNVLPEHFGFRIDERIIECPWVYSRLPSRPGVMLDAGSALNWKFLISRAPVRNAKLFICTLAPEKRCYWRRGVSYVFEDLRSTTFRNETFDTIVSISTIEHIGLDNTLLYTADRTKKEDDDTSFRAAIREFRRIIRPGGVCFITVPFGKACKRGWFQVFDSQKIEMVLESFQPTSQELQYFGYFPDGWRGMKPAELANATYFDRFQDKALGPDFAAAARGVVCMRLTA